MLRLFKLTILLLFCALDNVRGQSTDYSNPDKIAQSIPVSATKSTEDIANYINSNYTKSGDKVRAIYTLLASTIDYDIDNIFAINRYASTAEIINKTLKTRKAICQGYAETFHEICTKTGIKSFVVTGYTKQSGFVDYIPHAWVTAFVNDEWKLYDPTWGAGYIKDSKFYKQLNYEYYEVEPAVLIKDHMPFDPLWQLINPPLTSAEFYDHKTKGSGEVFNFNDSIIAYEKQDTIERLNASIRRIEANGIKNSLIYDQLNYLHRELDYRKQSIVVNSYNEAVSISNEAVNLFNKYIDYKNKQFTPRKTDPEIQKMVDEPETKVMEAKSILSSIKNPDQNLASSISTLDKMMDDILRKINDEKVFVKRYFSTSKVMRKTLFYQPR